MKLSVMQENLARGLSVVSRAVSSRSTLPVLANVLLRTEDAGLKLTATNLEIGITYWVPGKIETDGATTVPARLLTDLVGEPARLREGGPRAPGRGHAPPPLRPLRDPRQGHRRGRVPDDPDRRRAPHDAGQPEGPQAGARGDGLRGGQRRGPADPDRRPRPVRGQPADARRRRQLPDRGPDDRHPRPRRGGLGRHPGPRAHRAQPDPRRHGRPRGAGARPGPQPGPVPPRGRRPRVAPHRRPVPELPAGPAGQPRDAAPRSTARSCSGRSARRR